MPGGGKSTIGKLLAKRLDLPFADADSIVEQSAGCSIASLFEREGEAGFRKREASVLRELVERGPGVVATGGGVVLDPANRALLRDASVPIYLYASPPELWRRVRRNSRRPLLQVDDPYKRLCELFDVRHPFYGEVASITVPTGRPPMSAVADAVVTQLVQRGIIASTEADPSARPPFLAQR